MVSFVRSSAGCVMLHVVLSQRSRRAVQEASMIEVFKSIGPQDAHEKADEIPSGLRGKSETQHRCRDHATKRCGNSIESFEPYGPDDSGCGDGPCGVHGTWR